MSLSQKDMENVLRASFEDHRLSSDEKSQLNEIVKACSEEQRSFLRNRAFDIFREYFLDDGVSKDDIRTAYRWLEKSVKSLEPKRDFAPPEAFFSPGRDCLEAIIDCCQSAIASLDICVFTISDNRLSETILAAHNRGVKVRIITDDEKSGDAGSDVDQLQRSGVPLRMDSTSAHMHHKFAIVDGKQLINGSFNWTRSASERNQENILISSNPVAIEQFQEKFESLWALYR